MRDPPGFSIGIFLADHYVCWLTDRGNPLGEVETGQLTLKTVPDGNEEAIVAYLATIFKKVSRDKLTVFVRRTPAVLSRNVTATTANKIIVELERLAAAAVYSSNGSANTCKANQQTPTSAAGS